MADYFKRHDVPNGPKLAHGPRWVRASERLEEIEIYGLDHTFPVPGIRIHIKSNPDCGPGFACIAMDLVPLRN